MIDNDIVVLVNFISDNQAVNSDLSGDSDAKDKFSVSIKSTKLIIRNSALFFNSGKFFLRNYSDFVHSKNVHFATKINFFL